MELNCLEAHMRAKLYEQFDDRYLTIGRVAHTTVKHNGRGPCQYQTDVNADALMALILALKVLPCRLHKKQAI